MNSASSSDSLLEPIDHMGKCAEVSFLLISSKASERFSHWACMQTSLLAKLTLFSFSSHQGS